MNSVANSVAQIHPSAEIGDQVTLAPTVRIGPYAVVGSHCHLKDGVRVDAHAVIGDYTTLGEHTHVHPHAVVGGPSQDLKHEPGTVSYLHIGARNKIREFATVNRATDAGNTTRLGDDNLLMAYAHVAHDCQLGNHNVLANGATLGGHVTLESHVIVGAMTGIHQFVQVGEHTMVGAMSRVCNDVPPYMLVSGAPPKIYGLNQVGLRRAGFKRVQRQPLKQAFQLLYRQDLTLSEALAQIQDLLEQAPSRELAHLLDFCQHSQRGLVGYRSDLF